MSLSSQYRPIRPVNRLHGKAQFSEFSVPQMMAKAHRAMEAIAKNYSQWLQADLELLTAAQMNLRAAPHDPVHKSELFQIAHDIRGQAAGFGYELAGELATSLCRYLERTDHMGSVQLKVIAAHIDAIRAYVAQASSGDGGAVGRELLARLTALTASADPQY
jgi:chemotaxis protein histidine kinase CheA